ncbi:hypothetical protein [Parasulfitobacter algicola]|uniref:AEC family transporter n=1 Tax=Parasulfitobacter algicola TaxID=2614809 RepID=A0ABX2IRA4_9RHOB|nr:hypothetical protein [Sulfitobacter algicola]NSX54875.1 hypothetical protein [Sulfitobacter algicola]
MKYVLFIVLFSIGYGVARYLLIEQTPSESFAFKIGQNVVFAVPALLFGCIGLLNRDNRFVGFALITLAFAIPDLFMSFL